MLTGRARHEGDTLMRILHAAVLSEPFVYGSDVPEALAELCNRATAREPARRPQTAQQFRQELLDYLRHRSALALSDAASARLDALSAVLAEVPAGEPPRDLTAAYRLVTEARFGFTQSQREHPTSVPAQRGIHAAVTAQIDLELRQHHAETARALLGELSDPDPALADRVRAAEELTASRARAAAELQAMARDLDSSVGRRSRSLVLGLMALALALVSLAIGLGVAGPYTPAAALWAALAVGAGVGACTFVLRRTLWSNAFSRRLAGLLIVAIVVQVLNRAIGVAVDLPIADVLWHDLLISASFVTAASIALLPRLAWAVGPLAIGVVVIPLSPDLALLAYAVSLVGCVVLLAYGVMRRKVDPHSQA